MNALGNDVKLFKLHNAIADKLNLDREEIDGHQFSERFTLEELVILQKEISKAMQIKIMGA